MNYYNEIKNFFVRLYYLILVYCYAVFYVFKSYLEEKKKLQQDVRLKALEGSVALITGGARGIGLEVTKQLLNNNITVVIVGIYEEQKEGLKELDKLDQKEKVIFIECDLTSLQSIKECCKEFHAKQLPLNILINNAGIMFAPYFESEYGYEGQWSINYLSHFYLTHLLYQSLKNSCVKAGFSSRIVNVSSCLHYLGTINFKDINMKNIYSAEGAYCHSKLALVLFGKALNNYNKQENADIIINSVHPSVSFTKLYTNMWWYSMIPSILCNLLESPNRGADSIIFAALSPDIHESGQYFENCQVVEPSSEATSILIQEKLWRLSCQQLKIEKFGNIISY